jgi:multiple sugar transport system ATP-binding protein
VISSVPTNVQTGLAVESLRVRLGANLVVSDVSLIVGERELLVIVGPSGCGKTTLLRAIAGLVNLESGDVTLKSKKITNWPPAKRNIGMVFQEYALYSYRTVLGNIEFPLRMQGVTKIERRRRATEIASRLGISHLVGRRPHELSGGERQRVALSRALVRSPDLFLFDEPLSSVDATLQEELRSLLLDVQRESAVPALYVTHNQVEAWRIADRIAVMREGIILQVGTPSELYEKPASRFVAEFVSDVPMNTVPLALLSSNRQDALKSQWPDAAYLGVRLDDACVTQKENDLDSSENGSIVVPATFHHVERVGGRLVAVASAGGKKLRALLNHERIPETTDSVALKARISDIYLFSVDGTLIKAKGVA